MLCLSRPTFQKRPSEPPGRVLPSSIEPFCSLTHHATANDSCRLQARHSSAFLHVGSGVMAESDTLLLSPIAVRKNGPPCAALNCTMFLKRHKNKFQARGRPVPPGVSQSKLKKAGDKISVFLCNRCWDAMRSAAPSSTGPTTSPKSLVCLLHITYVRRLLPFTVS